MEEKIFLVLDFADNIEEVLKKRYPQRSWRILKESLDARGASRGIRPKRHYSVLLDPIVHQQNFPQIPILKMPIIIGAGPAGLFCALRLLEYGIPSHILERGEQVSERMKKIARFWRYNELDPDTNVCFGEGGAGLFSDGKLYTRVKSPHIPYVLKKLVEMGAPKETLYRSDPHLGSNRIRSLIIQIREYLIKHGCKISFGERVTGISVTQSSVEGVVTQKNSFESDVVVMGFGHSADELYRDLHKKNVALKAKNFSVGVRIEHPRSFIDSAQYGEFKKNLGAAFYRLKGKDCFSFCMCPGGYVLSSGTLKDGLVTNGMSNVQRNSPWSNSAMVVPVSFPNELFDGHKFQRSLEKKAWTMSEQGKIPAQRVEDFLEDRVSSELAKTSCPSKLVSRNLNELFPQDVLQSLRDNLEVFNRQIPQFSRGAAQILAPETRTSSPLTILRDPQTLESISHKGLYPCGEGAGYAGGITSSAADGVSVADGIIGKIKGTP